MTVYTVETKKKYISDGALIAYPIPFPFFKVDDIKAQVKDIVAIIVGWAIKDYITSQSLYNASVATGSLFGIYIVRGVEKIMRGFSDDPCGMIGRLRGRGDKEK